MVPIPPFQNEVPADFRLNETQNQFEKSLIISGNDLKEASRHLKPADKKQAASAVLAARKAFSLWSHTSIGERIATLQKAASLLRNRRSELAAWILLEVHKNRQEADADVCEAIDFLEYYGREMIRISEEEPNAKPLGVVAVIAPWNFPLAILTGMTSAALVTGNTVVMKPAEQSPMTALRLCGILEEAGIPKGVVNFLPGRGDEVGDFLVRSPDVALVAFTGSKEVGMNIASLKKRTIAEMGGKNAIIIDESADLEKAAEGTVASAFGYQGQKCSACSRVIILESRYEEFKQAFVEAARSFFMGPVIDEEAYQKITHYIEIGKKEAKLAFQGNPTKGGFFVPPTIFENVPPNARIAQEEIFGPVVCLMKARDLDESLRIANNVPYDLTGGLFSQNRPSIDRIKKEFSVGNLYINRKITGALVACQPFGGYRISSMGFKAGGPEYLYQFLETEHPPSPPAHRDLPSLYPNESNELLYVKEGKRLLSKTVCHCN